MGKRVCIAVIFLSFIAGADVIYAAVSAQAKRNLGILRKTGACVGCDLAGINLTRMDLSRTNLQGADLSFSLCNLASFAQADLRGAKFRGATLHGTDMEGANLRGADFTDTAMGGVFLAGALIDDSSLPAALRKEIVSASYDSQETGGAGEIAVKSSSKELLFITAKHRKKIVSAPLATGRGKGKGKKVPQLPAAVGEKVKNAREIFIATSSEKELQQLSTTVITITADKKKRRKTVMVSTDADGMLIIRVAGEKRVFSLNKEEGFTADRDSVASINSSEVLAFSKSSPLPQPVATDIVPKEITVKPAAAIKKVAEERAQDEELLLSFTPMSDPEENPQLLQLLKSKKCYGCDLSGLDLSGQSLVRVDLEGANLTGCNLQGADLRYANLKAAQLVQVKMQQARLDGADLYKANLSFANLTGASTEETDFGYARLKGVVGLEKE